MKKKKHVKNKFKVKNIQLKKRYPSNVIEIQASIHYTLRGCPILLLFKR